MAQPTIQELQQLARDVFGRELRPGDVEAFRGRLPTMARNVQRLREWEPKLRDAQPALVQRVSAGSDDD